MRDGVELLADHYRPLTPQPGGHAAGPQPLRPRVSGLGAVRQRLRRPRLPRHRAECSRHVRLRRRVQPVRPRNRRRRRHRGMAARPAVVHRLVRHHRASYLGFTQWALLTDPPPEMAAAVITVGPHDLSGPRWGTGSFGLNDFLGWNDVVAHQEDPGRIRAVVRHGPAQAVAGPRDGGPAARRGRPRAARRGRAVVRVVARAPRARRPVLGRDCNCSTALERAEVPVLLAHRLAGRVHRPDVGAVRTTAPARRAGRGHHRLVDPRRT